MNKTTFSLITSAIYSLFYGSFASADFSQQCAVGVPIYSRPIIQGSPALLPVKIVSEHVVTNPENATFTGKVEALQGNRYLAADQVKYIHKENKNNKNSERIITATGNVQYDDEQVKLYGQQVWTDLNSNHSSITDGEYQFVGRQGRGKAKQIELNDSRYITIDHGTYTTCIIDKNDWSIEGSKIIQDTEEELVKIKHARFKIGPVPVLYTPYLQFPTGKKRRTGLLIPITKYSNSNGIELGLPIYWNILPNFDATITPYVISKRGFQLQNEFRYLLGIGQGLFEIDWLFNPRNSDRDNRWLFHWQHGGVIKNNWRFNVDYTKVSDNRYLSDIDTPFGASTDGYISQKYSIGYADPNWNISLSMKQFQVFSDGGNRNTYRAMPQLDLNYYLNALKPFDFEIFNQAAFFISENVYNPKVARIHIEPVLSLPLRTTWGSLNTKIKLPTTYYSQNIPEEFANDYLNRTGKTAPNLKNDVIRFIPQYKLNGKMIFERNISRLKGLKGYTQTLEPQFQYLYVPYKDQSDIYIYDTTLLQSDYAGLFRDRSYGGLDRIASANQITLGVTTRLHSNQSNEVFNFSVGQIYAFEPARTGGDDTSINESISRGTLLTWATDAQWNIGNNFTARGGTQYDKTRGNFSIADFVLEYRKDEQRMVQFNYRYASKEYISAIVTGLSVNNPVYQQDIFQVGVTTSWPITNNWTAVASYYYDPKLLQTNDALLGIQYANCCWGFSTRIERKIVDWDKNSQYDTRFGFSIELRGLGGGRQVMNPSKMLNSNILPYQRAF